MAGPFSVLETTFKSVFASIVVVSIALTTTSELVPISGVEDTTPIILAWACAAILFIATIAPIAAPDASISAEADELESLFVVTSMSALSVARIDNLPAAITLVFSVYALA